MLRVENIAVGYGLVRVLTNISFGVEPGEAVAILGRNGAGKTTLLKALMGVLPLQKGRVFFDGEDISPLKPWQRVERGVALVPEGRHIFAPLTVRENLELGAFHCSKGASERLEKVLALFPALRRRLKVRAGVLSGGEQQMLAIGRALMSQPRCLFLDEPSMGLAPKVAHFIFDVLSQIKKELALLIVEQNVSRVLKIADRLLVLDDGQIKWEFSGKEADISRVEEVYFGK